ncbi:hypothetical protein A2U01_0007994, partial [Trifolium medium]|nr:hypothetical protein [Trifolium medium]
CGSLSVDFLATVAAYPKPDESDHGLIPTTIITTAIGRG